MGKSVDGAKSLGRLGRLGRKMFRIFNLSISEKEKDIEKQDPEPSAPAPEAREDGEEEELEIDQAIDDLRQMYVDQRGSVLHQATAVIHDLLHASLSPLGKGSDKESDKKFKDSVRSKFLSAFTQNATWVILWPEHSGHEAIYGMLPTDVYQEYCFPLITFHWNILGDISCLIVKDTPRNEPITIESTFFAWGDPLDPGQDPLVAMGYIKDRIVVTDGSPLISHRTFSLERIMKPAWMEPARRPSRKLDVTNPIDGGQPTYRLVAAGKLSLAYQKSSLRIRWLRKYKRWVTPLVAFSSLFGAIQNVGLGDNLAVNLVFAILGILSSVLGICLLLLDYLVEVTDASIRRESLEQFTMRGKYQPRLGLGERAKMFFC